MDGVLGLSLVVPLVFASGVAQQVNASIAPRCVQEQQGEPSTEPQPGLFGAALWGQKVAGQEWIAIGAPKAGSEALPEVGEVLVLADRQLAWRECGVAPHAAFGTSLVAFDREGSGAPDTLAIGAPQSWDASKLPPASPGRLEIRSLSDGELLCEALGTLAGDSFGAALCALGDVDGDGFADLAVGAPQAGRARDVPSELPGYVALVSSQDGSILWTVAGPEANRRFGASLARIGDVDGDGLEDFVVGAAGPSEAVWAPGAIFGLSAKTGDVLFEAAEDGPVLSVGATLAPAGDLDRDGLDDALAIGVRAPLSKGARDVDVLLLSGASGSLKTFGTVRNASTFGAFSLAAGRWRDGRPRIAVGMAANSSTECDWRIEVLDEYGSRWARFELDDASADDVSVAWCAFSEGTCVTLLADPESRRESTWLVGAPDDFCWGSVAVFDGVRWGHKHVIREQEFLREFKPR